MTIFDFRKHKSCLYLLGSLFTASALQPWDWLKPCKYEEGGLFDSLILLISAKITSDNTSRAVFADIYSLIFCSKTALRFIHLIHFNNYFQPEGSQNIHKIHHIKSIISRYCQLFPSRRGIIYL